MEKIRRKDEEKGILSKHIFLGTGIPYGMKKMKRRMVGIFLALVIGYGLAVGLCLRALNAPAAVANISEMKIVVDAGHGGIDGGVVGVGTRRKESDVNLSISFLVKERLTDMGFSVVMTRSTDCGLYGTTLPGFKRRDLEKRKAICESAAPTFVLSIHQNFYPSSSSRGGQVFYEKSNPQSQSLAENVQRTLNALYEKQGVKPRVAAAGDYYMLKIAPPSVIVECGFLSNPKDDALLADRDFCGRLADAIAAGVLSEIKNLAAT